MNPKLQALYGLKFHPFRADIPTEALFVTPVVDAFCRRVEFSLTDGGFAMVTGDPGSGKSIALRVLEDRLRRRQDLIVGTIERPIGRASDFYRELGDIFGVSLHGHNRWAGFKTLREKWSEHIATTLTRPVLIVDEAQEMISGVFTELRLLSSKNLDARSLLCVVFAGDGRLPDRFRAPDLLPPRLQDPSAAQARARWSRRTRRLPRPPPRRSWGSPAHDHRAAHHRRRARRGQLPRAHEPLRRAAHRRRRARPPAAP